MTGALAAVGAVPAVRGRMVDAIPAGAAGKRPLVLAHHRTAATAGGD